MEIVEYDSSMQDEWDSFVDNSKNGTIFHKQKFLSYHNQDKFKDRSLVFKDSGKTISVFPAAEILVSGQKVLKSHPGSSYGGALFDNTVGVNKVKEVIENIIEYSICRGFSAIEMRLPEHIFCNTLSGELEFILTYLDFKIVQTELSSAVCLVAKNFSDIESNFSYDTKRSYNKAKNSGMLLVAKPEEWPCDVDIWNIYWGMLYNNLQEKHRASPTHSVAELIKLKELFPEDINLFCSFIKDKLISGTLVFKCNKEVAHTFYIAQDYNYQNFRPLNLVFTNLIYTLYKQGFKYLNFGISTESGGTAINEGLFRFKEGFGARGAVRRYYRKEL